MPNLSWEKVSLMELRTDINYAVWDILTAFRMKFEPGLLFIQTLCDSLED